MKKLNLKPLIKNIQTGVDKYSPEILVGFGVAGMIAGTVLAVKATPKAIKLIENEKKERKVDELKPIEVVKVAWKPYIPVVVTCGVSVACILGGCSKKHKRMSALAAAYKLSEQTFSDYKSKVIETIGEKKEKIIKDKVNEERVKKNPVSNNQVIVTNRGDTLCYDYLSGRYFRSDISKIERTINILNQRMMVEMYVSLTDLYLELGIEKTGVSDELGWRIDDGLIEFNPSSQIADDGTPCIVLDFVAAPKYDYDRYY